jgi:iron complex transport system substrate-binding protein
MSKKSSPALIRSCLVPLLIILILGHFAESAAREMRPVTDRTGRTVQVPVEPKRIACFFGPSYEKAFLFGFGDRVAAMSIKQTPWAHKLNPALKKVVVMPSYSDPDTEKILQLWIDLVFYWQWPQQTQKMTAAGIPVVCPMDTSASPSTCEAFMQRYKDDIRFYGESLGPKARKIAEDYCRYYDQKIRRVIAVTKNIPEAGRPSVYYVIGKNTFSTQGKNSLAYWLVEMAGGSLVSKELGPGFADASMEQIIAWNPEVIVICGTLPSDTILADPRWQSIRAVRNRRVHLCPEGVFLWGHGSSEVHLFIMWLSKILHPDRFQSLQLEREIKDYYSRFYHYKLTDDDVQRILKRLPPAS